MKKIFYYLLVFTTLKASAQKCEMLFPPSSEREVPVMQQAITLPDSSAWMGIYYETDYAIYQDCGYDTNAVKTRLLGWFNGVRRIYSRSGVRVYIAGYKIWTVPDPYITAVSSSQGINLFGVRMDSLQIDADKYQLLSMHCVGCGGISYVGTLGYPAFYRVSFCGMVSGNETNGEAYPLSWNIMVMTHEMGHSISCQHTHTPVWNGNNTMIDSCGCIATGGCTSYVGGGFQPLPAGGGTIMSYCHLIGTVGISGIKGFGTEPGESLRYAIEYANLSGVLYHPGGLDDCSPAGFNSTTTTTTATINWSSIAPQFKYKYRIKGATWSAALSTTSKTVTLSGLSPFTIYQYRVKAKCNVWTPFSTAVQFKTK